jgi:hypothetical protein
VNLSSGIAFGLFEELFPARAAPTCGWASYEHLVRT